MTAVGWGRVPKALFNIGLLSILWVSLYHNTLGHDILITSRRQTVRRLIDT